MGTGGSRFPSFVQSKKLVPYLGQELREKLDKPLVFQGLAVGENAPPPSRAYGYDVTILIDVCKSVVAAEADGIPIRQSVARQAHVILGASAKAGIKGLVYALAGYNPGAEEIIASFRAYVLEEAKKYEKEFPPAFRTAVAPCQQGSSRKHSSVRTKKFRARRNACIFWRCCRSIEPEYRATPSRLDHHLV